MSKVGTVKKLYSSFMFLIHIYIIVVNDCASSPCQNGGECVDEYLTFSCNCVGTSHTGNQCQEPIQIMGEV